MPQKTSCKTVKINIGGLILLELWLVAFMAVNITRAQNHSDSRLDFGNAYTKSNLTNNFIESANSKHLKFRHVLPFRMDFFLKSLKELEIQERHNIRRKKSVKRNEKKMQATEMRDRIKDLMSNISRTLNDVDWYFSYEQLDDQKNKGKEYFVSEPTQKLVIKRMKEVDEDISDVFVDSFVRQMYDLDPSILDKINDRIDSEFSSDTNLSRDTELSNDRDLLKLKRAARLASTVKARRARVSTALVNEEYSYVDAIAGDELLTKIPNYLNGVNKLFKHENIARMLAYNPNMKETTTTTEATTFENFYDYGDYYKESEEDKLRDVAHYEIVQDVLHSTRGINKDYDDNSYKFQIKNKNKKTRNFHKNKEILKKRLKNKLENFGLKNYKGYNTDSDY